MKRQVLNTVVSTLFGAGVLLGGAGVVSAATPCPTETLSYGSSVNKTVNRSNVTVTTGAASKLTVNGSNDCVDAASSNKVTVNGDNNSVTAGAGSTVTVAGSGNTVTGANLKVSMTGAGNYFVGLGNNRGDVGGATCSLQPTDKVTGCAVDETTSLR
jgi:hypothetical protein